MSAPDIAIKSYPIEVASWKNVHDGRTSWSTTLTKSFKDKDTGKYRDTKYLHANDLLIASALLQEMYTRIAIEDKSNRARPVTVAASDEETPY